MDLKQLRYFVSVADFGGFSRAAEVLAVAQSALSRQVSDLELELGQRLFYRTGRGATLTEAGKRLYAHGRGLLEQASRARQDLLQFGDLPVGKVVLGLPFSIGRIFSGRFVRAFSEAFPQAALSIIEASSEHILEWLALGRVDIGLVFNPTNVSGIKTKLLVEDELCLIAAPKGLVSLKKGATVHLRDIPKLPIIIPSSPHTLRTFVDTHLLRARLALNVKVEVDNVSTIVDLVRENVGAAILPGTTLLAYPGASDLVAYRFVAPRLPFKLKIATCEIRPQTVVVRRSVELIEAKIAQLVATEHSSKNEKRTFRKGARNQR